MMKSVGSINNNKELVSKPKIATTPTKDSKALEVFKQQHNLKPISSKSLKSWVSALVKVKGFKLTHPVMQGFLKVVKDRDFKEACQMAMQNKQNQTLNMLLKIASKGQRLDWVTPKLGGEFLVYLAKTNQTKKIASLVKTLGSVVASKELGDLLLHAAKTGNSRLLDELFARFSTGSLKPHINQALNGAIANGHLQEARSLLAAASWMMSDEVPNLVNEGFDLVRDEKMAAWLWGQMKTKPSGQIYQKVLVKAVVTPGREKVAQFLMKQGKAEDIRAALAKAIDQLAKAENVPYANQLKSILDIGGQYLDSSTLKVILQKAPGGPSQWDIDAMKVVLTHPNVNILIPTIGLVLRSCMYKLDSGLTNLAFETILENSIDRFSVFEKKEFLDMLSEADLEEKNVSKKFLPRITKLIKKDYNLIPKELELTEKLSNGQLEIKFTNAQQVSKFSKLLSKQGRLSKDLCVFLAGAIIFQNDKDEDLKYAKMAIQLLMKKGVRPSKLLERLYPKEQKHPLVQYVIVEQKKALQDVLSRLTGLLG